MVKSGRLPSLAKAGINVTAIDLSQKSVALARSAGIDVQLADIGSFSTSMRFDAVLISMVAHHIHPLAPALDRVRNLLKPGGKILVEDFAVEDADEPTAAWYYDTLAMFEVVGLAVSDEHLTNTVEAPLDAWRRDHRDDHHAFNRSADILTMVRERFEVKSVERGPYFYRYVAAAVAERTGQDHGAALHALEDRMIAAKRGLRRSGSGSWRRADRPAAC